MSEGIILGTIIDGRQEKGVLLQRQDRRRHLYIIGKTGTGKSTLLKNLITQDIRDGEGVAVLDPHGDLVEELLNYIPSYRINDVVYFNPADLDYPVGFNILNQADSTLLPLVASNCVSVFKNLWSDSWGPRLEYILHNSILSLLEIPNSSLLLLPRLLTDQVYREEVIKKLQNSIVKNFWLSEFNRWNQKFQSEAISPVQNKVGAFLSDSLLRNILSQSKNKFDLGWMMDNRKIFLANLSAGQIGQHAANLLGGLLITQFHLSSMKRARLPEERRQDFYLYADEIQNFSTESFSSILSESRKYRLNLTLANQYLEQIPERIQKSIFGNIGSLVAFRVGSRDAEILKKEFAPFFDTEDLQTARRYEVHTKISVNGLTIKPFYMGTLPPEQPALDEGRKETIIKLSRQKYALKRQVIEEQIRKWLNNKN